MTNKVWCSDIYDLNSSNTTLNYEHDTLYREYAATSIGDLIDRMQDRIDRLDGEVDEVKEEADALEAQVHVANYEREKALNSLTDAIALLNNAKDILDS